MMPLHATFERMEPKAGEIHSDRAAATVQNRQDTQEFRHISLRDPRGVPLLI